MSIAAKTMGQARPHAEEHEDPREHLMHDPRPRGEMNSMILESMHTAGWKYYAAVIVLSLLVATCFFYAWGYMIANGLGVAGVNRPVYWGIFLVNTVFWIGISHAGTFISAILRVMKIEGRRPFTRAAELMTTFGLVQAGASIFMHMGRVWLAPWLFPFPNERGLWPDFHSPLMWDFLAINTYLLCSTMYLFLPLIPDLAMVRDRMSGWRKIPYKILSLGFRDGDEAWLVFVRVRAVLRDRRAALRDGRRGDRAVPDSIDHEEHEVLPAARAFQSARQADVDRFDVLGLLLLQ